MAMKTDASTLRIDQTWISHYFEQFYKEPKDFLMGLEAELIGVYEKTGEAVPYAGGNGIEGILQDLIQFFHWEPIEEAGKIIALKRDTSEIHLEPGGQLELSGTPFSKLKDNLKEIQNYYEELKNVSQGKGIAWVELGSQPFSSLSSISWVPKTRYQIMRDYFSKKGGLGHSMMKQTATLQANLDYSCEEDAMKKLRTAMVLAPVMIGLFANSPILDGHFKNAMSTRAIAWQNTDSDRCGLISEILVDEPRFQDYLKYLERVPVIFMLREGRWISLPSISFKRFLEGGYSHFLPEEIDWELFLTSIFTEARLNPFVEIRSADRNKLALSSGMLALWKGLLLNSQAREAVWSLLRSVSSENRQNALRDAAQKGFQGQYGPFKIQDLGEELLKLASNALKDLWEQDIVKEDERHYLGSIEELLKEGQSPAEKILKSWQGSWNQNPQDLITYAKI